MSKKKEEPKIHYVLEKGVIKKIKKLKSGEYSEFHAHARKNPLELKKLIKSNLLREPSSVKDKKLFDSASKELALPEERRSEKEKKNKREPRRKVSIE